jgi:hypothetical protein
VVLGFVLMLAVALIALLLVRGTATAAQPATEAGVVVSAATSAAPSDALTIPSASTTTSAASSATARATVTVTATRTAAATGPQVASFAVVPQAAISGTTVTCTKATNLLVDFRWTTTGATGVYFGVMTTDAQVAPYLSNLPANGSLGAQAVVFPCYADAGDHMQIYTLTVTSNGQKVSRTITLKEKYVP